MKFFLVTWCVHDFKKFVIAESETEAFRVYGINWKRCHWLCRSRLKDTMKFKHNCTSCKYLGFYYGCDVYICDNTILARYGDRDYEYGSGLLSVVVRDLTNKESLADVLKHNIKWEIATLFALISRGTKWNQNSMVIWL